MITGTNGVWEKKTTLHQLFAQKDIAKQKNVDGYRIKYFLEDKNYLFVKKDTSYIYILLNKKTKYLIMAKKSKAELQKELSAGKSVAEVAAENNPETIDANVAIENSKATEAPKETPKAPGKIKQILDAFKSGKTNKEIAAMYVLDADGKQIPTGENDKDGNPIFETFHPTTISIQVSKYKKANPDLYPPQPPAPTKKELAEKAKAEKAAAEATKQSASAEADVANVQG
jgi:hypothetical protein